MPSFKEKLSEEKKEPKSPFCLRACCGKFQGPLQIGRWRAQRHLSGDRAGTIYRGVPRSSDFYRGMGSQWFEGGGGGREGRTLRGRGNKRPLSGDNSPWTDDAARGRRLWLDKGSVPRARMPVPECRPAGFGQRRCFVPIYRRNVPGFPNRCASSAEVHQ